MVEGSKPKKPGPKVGSKNTIRKQQFQDVDRIMVALALALWDLGIPQSNAVNRAIRYLYGTEQNSTVIKVDGKPDIIEWRVETLMPLNHNPRVRGRMIKVSTLEEQIIKKMRLHKNPDKSPGKTAQLETRPGINLSMPGLGALQGRPGADFQIEILTPDEDWIERARDAYRRWNDPNSTLLEAEAARIEASRLETITLA